LRALAGLLDPQEVIGDLGCGTGQVSQWLAPFSERIIAVDSSKEMLRTAKDRLTGHRHVELRQGSLEKLPIDAGELDVALLLLVLHHVPVRNEPSVKRGH
jgi:ArsR family transcriptional regulator